MGESVAWSIKTRDHHRLWCHQRSHGQHGQAGDCLLLQKGDPTLATGDFFLPIWNLCIQRIFHPDGSKARVEQREAPEETPLLEELGKVLVRPQIQRRQHVPRTPFSAAIMRRIQEKNAGAPSTWPIEPPSPSSCVVWTDLSGVNH